jgi:hypothetical protein
MDEIVEQVSAMVRAEDYATLRIYLEELMGRPTSYPTIDDLNRRARIALLRQKWEDDDGA